MIQLNADQRAGQRLMIGFDGTQLDDRLRYCIDRLGVGGLILFSRNLESPEQIADLCSSAQEHARQCGHPPLFIGIDQEGGSVARLKPPFTIFKGAPYIRTEAEAVHFARVTARELTRIGVNMDMAPVLDVLPPQGESVMTDRSFGNDPEQVARMGCTIIEHLQRNGVLSVAKHFPGIGRTVLDSHEDLPDLDTSAEALAGRDVLPFKAAIGAQAAGMMLSHIRYRALDPHWPASLSRRIAHDLLREQLGYQGLVLTDDVDMGAIANHYNAPDIVRQCLNASVDILLVCHESPKIDAIFDLIREHQACGGDMAGAAENALQRILAAKRLIADIRHP